jgi:hypothetical protein
MLGKKIVGPRDAVVGWDPAVDQDASDFEAYREALFDADSGSVKFHPGATPTRWRIGPLTAAQLRHARALPDVGTDRIDYVFCCGIHGISNYVIEDPAGEHEVKQPDRKPRPGMGDMASLEWLRDSGIAVQDVEAVAAMILLISEPRPSSCRPSVPPAGR